MQAALARFVVLGKAVVAVLVQIGVWLRIDRGSVWLVRTWTIGGALRVLVWWLGGSSGPLEADDGIALVSGLGALVLAAALYDGRLIPVSSGRR